MIANVSRPPFAPIPARPPIDVEAHFRKARADYERETGRPCVGTPNHALPEPIKSRFRAHLERQAAEGCPVARSALPTFEVPA